MASPAAGTVLVINTGSSSVKYRLLAMPQGRRLAGGLLENIGSDAARLLHRGDGEAAPPRAVAAPDHPAAMRVVFDALESHGLLDPSRLDAVGHRLVHGGQDFTEPTLVDDRVITRLEAIRHLAPLHHAANLAGIRTARERLPGIPQVAVFDTGLHHDMPAAARVYALPLALQRTQGIRRFGFHGISHQYVAGAAAETLGRPLQALKLITLHLGNGASACAIRHGRSIDTSMGFTPLEGLVMGSRCGDLDPALPAYLADRLDLSCGELERLLNTESGLLGLCGDSDMRAIERRMADGDSEAHLAFELFCYRILKYIGAYHAVLNGIDGLVFTAGIGEHSRAVRSRVCRELDALGIVLDETRNAAVGNAPAFISPPDARVAVLVIPTDEERQIAAATLNRLKQGDTVPPSAAT